MDVTNKTFWEKLPEIKEAIAESTFVSIDCEFSGLHSSYRPNTFDTPTEYFKNLHAHIKKFLVLQFGLAIFRYDRDKNVFFHKGYNFYTFPKQLNNSMPDHTFSCQSSTMDFLISHEFDFNKLFQEGISYLNSEEDIKYKEKLATTKTKLSTSIPNTRDEKVRRSKILKLTNIDKNIEDVDKAVGFSSLMTYLSESQKLIIGHNMFLDIFHTVDKFMAPLSDDYALFKECVTCLFPLLLDTKHLSSEPPFKSLVDSTILTQLLPILSKEPFKLPALELEEGCEGYSIENPKDHNAGYDAYITGVCFISMWKYLGEKQNFPPNAIYDNFNLLQQFFNRLSLARLQDINFIQINGTDPQPSRNHVFYLTFPQNWGLHEIMQLFSPFGNVSISFLSNTAAYVSLFKRNIPSNKVMAVLSKLGTNYSIMTFNKRRDMLKMPTPKQSTCLLIKTIGESPDVVRLGVKRKVSEEITPSPILPRKKIASKTFKEDSEWD